MKPLRDPLGRPIRRIYLKTDVLDRRCEGIIREFMNRRSGGYRLPIPTDELVRLIEERAAKVDTYADLPEGIHGRTSLFYDRAPIVKIAESIYRTRSDHRVRTTICHEFGHVWLHAPLWYEAGARRSKSSGPAPVWNCNRESITNPSQYDWTEWQAGWVSGAILMPASAICEWSAECASKFGTRCPFGIESLPAAALINTVLKRCDVSVLAARVRLKQLNLLNEPSASASNV